MAQSLLCPPLIENFHAVLEHVGSSIRDSLRGKGDRTLVLNDEVHHVYNRPLGRDKTSQGLKKWKEFLVDTDFNFKYVGGFSGTCYIENEYFTEVIYRFSLREAIEQGFVKKIEYVAEDTSQSKSEKFQKMHHNHREKKRLHHQVKPLTIMVTKDIATCKAVAEDLVLFLAEHEGISKDAASRKVLPVSSASEHHHNVLELKEVDNTSNPVEWVVSVSMLSEGWDVQNVFQIVPHEERAFNSKLLIAQVLGRGLRVPPGLVRPTVTVFNHDAWSSRIKDLVLEVMEVEKRLHSYVINKSENYNFDLHHIDYKKIPKTEEIEEGKENELEQGYIKLVSQLAEVESETVYAQALSGKTHSKTTRIQYKMYTVDEVAEVVYNRLRSIDMETGGKTQFSKHYDLERLQTIIRTSLQRIGVLEDIVSSQNRQRILEAFGSINKGSAKRVRYRSRASGVQVLNTSKRPSDSVGYASLRRSDAKVFYDEDAERHSSEDTQFQLKEVSEDMHLEGGLSRVGNTYNFKTPLNIVIANHGPEFKFIKGLVRQDNASVIDAWLKSTDRDFYSIEYAWKKGPVTKRAFFNPDFFIKKGSHVLVIEIKADDETRDPSLENKAKFLYARRHFNTINEMQDDVTYFFHFLTPKDYDKFFQFIREGGYESFVSELDAALEESANTQSVNGA